MDAQRLAEIEAARQALDNGATAYDAIVSNVSSGVDAQTTLGFLGDVSKREEEYQLAKSVYNGAIVQGGRGIIGTAKMLNELYAERAMQNGYVKNKEDLMIGWNNVLESSPLQRYNTDNTYLNALAEGGGQLLGQIGVGLVTRGIGSMPYMGVQIAGNQYLELKEKGVDTQRAAAASIINTAIQTPLEKIGLDKILKGLPAGSPIRKKFMEFIESAATEGFTEFVQEFPEQFTNIWAENPNLDAQGIARKWDENANENIKSALLSSSIGAILGGGTSGAKIALQQTVGRKIEQKIHEDKLNKLKENIEDISKTNINPQYAIAAINNVTQGNDNISVDAEALHQYMQQVGADKVTETLGVTAEEVQKAAEEGLDIEVQKGNFIGTAKAQGEGFYTALQEHISFEDSNGYSTNLNNLTKALRQTQELTDTAKEDLDIEVGMILESAKEAGIADAQTSGLKELLISRAMIANPENPAQYFKDHPLEFQNAGKVDGTRGLYKQRAFHGTSANFERFDNKYLHHGIYGYGHYFAADENVARGYGSLSEYYIAKGNLDGNVYETEIPENNDLIDWNAPLNSQEVFTDGNHDWDWDWLSNIVENKKALSILSDSVKNGKSGKDMYNQLSEELGGDEKASRFLLELGILGVKYNGGKDGASFVVFDADYTDIKDRKTIDNYKQSADAQDKGAIGWDADGKAIINLFKGADASTVIHETGHYFLENFMLDSAKPEANAQIKKDRASILKFVGMTEEQWQKADFEGRRKAHEIIAENFETYIIEGKAPNRELRSVFKRFSKWLKAVYSSIVNNEKVYDVNKRNKLAREFSINDEVRQVFDRWLASEEQIKAEERIEGYFAKLPNVVTDNLTDRQKESIKNFIEKAHDKAVDLMTKDAMQIFTQERKEEVAKIRAQAKDRAEREIKALQVYKAIDILHKEVPGWARANAKTLARKYLSKGGQVYGDYANAKAEVDADINERINPILDIMREGIDNHPRTYWIDKETGLEVDVSDLESYGADELKSGFQFQKVTEDNSAAWWLKYQSINSKRKPSKAKMREIAIEAYMGNDTYGILAEEYTGLNIQETEAYKQEVAERKAEMEELLKREKTLQAQGNQAQLFKKFYMSDEMRVWWDLAAEKAGYDSGNAMAKDIQSNPTYKQAVEQHLNEIVEEFLPDKLKDPKKAEEAAREALYNDESGMVSAVELQIIQDYANGVNAKSRSVETVTKLAQAMKQAAENAAKTEIAQMNLRNALNYRKYVKAERRAAAKAKQALKDGDTEAAVSYKKQQLFNHALVRESLAMRQQVEKNLKFLKRQKKLKKDTWGKYDGAENHFNQAAFLLARMGIGRKDFDVNAREQTLAQYIQQQQQENGNYIDIAEWLTNETIDISSPDKLTFEQYQDVIDALKNIKALSNAQNKSSKLAKDVAWKNFKDEIHEHLAEMQERYRVKPGEKPKAKFFRELLVTSLRSTDNLLEFMDNWHFGYFSKKFGEPLKMCADMQSTMEMKFKDYAAKAYLKWCPDEASRKAVDEKVYYDELGISCDKRWLIQMVANLGNEGNARMLCSTMPMEIQDAITKDKKTCNIWVQPSESVSVEEAWHQTRDNLVEFLGRNLTSNDIAYAQSLIDNAGRHWNERAELDRRTKGFAPNKVQATPVVFKMKDGSAVVLKGGYFPLVRDSRMGSHPANLNSVSDTDPNEGRNINPMHTNTGSSKNRTMATYPVSLIPGCEFRSVMDGIHDICYREVIADFRKIFNDEDLVKIMKEKMGVAEYEHLRETIESTANPYGNTHMVQAERWQADCISWLRRKTVNAAIMLNLKTAFQNLSNVTLFGNAVEGFTQADAWRSVYEYGFAAADIKNRELHDFVMNKSVFMKERVTEPDISLKEIINEGEMNAIEKVTTEWGAKMLAYTDNLTAIPCWVGAYNKKINAGATEQEAINFADTVVRRTLGSSRIQDVSSLQRGGPIFKMLTTFQGFWNTQFNQWDREIHILRRDLAEGKRKEAAMRFSAFLAAKFFMTCLISCAMGLENPFDDDKKGNNNWVTEIRQYPLSMAGPLGQAGNFLINSALGTSSYSYRMAAIQSTIDKGIKLARTGNRFVNGKAGYQDLFESITSLAGPVFGVPDEINKLFWNNYDYLFNGMSPELHDLVARRPKNER